MGKEKAEPEGMRPYRLTGRVALAAQVMDMVEHWEGLASGEVEK